MISPGMVVAFAQVVAARPMERVWTKLTGWVQTPDASAIARTLLHSLWEGAAVALLLSVVLYVARSSRVRYAAASFAMVLLLSTLVATFSRLAPQTAIPVRPVAGRHFPGLPEPFALPPVERRDLPVTDELAWLVPFWIAGVLIFHLRGVAGWMAARRLRNTGVCCAPEVWLGRLEQLRMRLRMERPVALLESCLGEVPVVMGYVRPVILMPVGVLAGLPVAQVEAILLHELAHIRRYDYLVNVMQVFVEGLLFYHPAVWWISGVMRAERENCCDDVVVAVTGEALEYATALTALEQRRENAGLALTATGGSLVNRIQRLLGRRERRYGAAMPVITAAILTVTAVSVMVALQVGSGGKAGGAAQVPVAVPHTPTQAKQKPAEPILSTQVQQVAKPGVEGERKEFVEQFWLRRDPAIGLHIALVPQAAGAAMTAYEKWIREDVAYIISDEERRAFSQLATDEEWDKFIEQFWARRDPTPGTPENEYKTEHYRRIAYANNHFAGNIPGWRTDRGRIYIQYGPPDEIEAHSVGGAYRRPAAEGGGETETFPFEQWRYRWIEGVGQNVILEFVDKTMNGDYKMTMDPKEKDMLFRSQPDAPGANSPSGPNRRDQ